MSQPTILDVAERAGVSKSLVSLVMRRSDNVSNEKREAVLRAAEELGYRPNAVARSLVSRRSQHLGLMVSDLRNPFFAEVANGVMGTASDHNYRVLVNTGFMSPAREAEALDAFIELRMDGILMAGARIESRVIRRIAAIVPVVAITRQVRLPGVDVVVNDDRHGARLAVDHLVGLGHRRIAHIDGGAGSGAKRRVQGYRDAMRAHGLGEHIQVVAGDYTEEAGKGGVDRLLSAGPKPTAVFCANDYQAIGALDALESSGYPVPDAVSVVGYDNVSLSSLSQIDLTTVSQPQLEMGQRAAQLLFERLEGNRTTERREVIAPELLVRGTTASPRA